MKKDISQIVNAQGERLDVAYHAGDKEGVLVVLGHGVTGNKDRPVLVALAEGLSKLGWPCLRFSFAGNGDSEGDFREANITKEVEDLKAVLASVPQEQRVAYIGHSMGGAVGVLTAVSSPDIQALVSLAGMVRTADFVDREFGDVEPDKGVMWEDEDCPLSLSFVDDLNSIGDILDEAAEVTQPWLFVHGSADDVVPLQDSKDAYAAASCRKELVEIAGAGHVFGDESYEQVVEAIDGFLKSCLG